MKTVLESVLFVFGVTAIAGLIFAAIGYWKILRKYYVWDKCVACGRRFMGRTGDFLCPACRPKKQPGRRP